MGLNKCTQGDWRVRFFGSGGVDTGDNDFFVESQKQEGQAYGIEILMEDYGDHNGYPRAQRLADATLIAHSKVMYEALDKILNWELPASDNSLRVGVRDYLQKIASEALPKI